VKKDEKYRSLKNIFLRVIITHIPNISKKAVE